MKPAAIILAWAVLLAGCDGAARGSKDKTPPVRTEQKLGQQFYEGAPDKLGPGDVVAKRGDIKVYIDSWSINCFFYDDNVKAAFKGTNFDVDRHFNGCGQAAFDYGVVGKLTVWWKKHIHDGPASRNRAEASMKTTGRINNGRNIFRTQYLSLNAQGKLYKLTLTARQGNMLWMKSVEWTNSVAERKEFNCDIRMDGVGDGPYVEPPDEAKHNSCAQVSIPRTVQKLAKLLSDDISE